MDSSSNIKCPYFQQPKPEPEEPSQEVLEELAHQKEIRDIHYSTQKIVHEIQHTKMKLVLLKLTKEIDQLSSVPEIPEVLVQNQEVVPEPDVQKGELEV
jgi:ribosomal protein L7Ae-like RNA K-turn-binding protein